MTTAAITLSPDQQLVADAIFMFPASNKPLLTIGGLAGTGKTTTLGVAIKNLRQQHAKLRIAFCAYTGRAASILKSKLVAGDSFKGDEIDYCGTIHGLIYKVETDELGAITNWYRVANIPYDLIVLDEASMADGDIFRDLASYRKPIIAVGDHGQLPPVNGRFNLMEKPQLRLEKIHRQAEGNPIIHLSMLARQDGFIPFGEFGPGVRKVGVKGSLSEVCASFSDLNDIMFLCGFNAFRCNANATMRKLTGAQTNNPMAGEKVICLRNMASKGIFNGMIGFIDTINSQCKNTYRAVIRMEDGTVYNGKIAKGQFGIPTTLAMVPGATSDNPVALFDFGMALTVHKSQGSQSERVVLFEQRNSYQTDDDWRRWLYTAVTRSSRDLTIISGRL